MFYLKKVNYLVLLLNLCFAIFSSSVYAGTTGKISGKVIDKSTGEPIPFVNILIAGTNMGAAADINGNYFIINIPPGTYNVRASNIGYSSSLVENIRVSVDQTTKVDFELTPSSVQLSDVIVQASRPLVQKDLTSTEAKVSGDQISMLPLEDVSSVVNLQAGVVDGHFRGGRSNEVKYLIDGVPVNDAYSGQSSLSADINNIQELQVLTGTFNAEYGEALSGVVNQVTKIPGDKLRFQISSYSGDYFSTHNNIFQHIDNINPSDAYNFQGSISGPLPIFNNFVKFLLSGRYSSDNGAIYGQRIFNPSDSSNFSDNNPKNWYIGATGDKKYVPMNYSRKLSLQGKLEFDIGGGRGLVLNGMLEEKNYRNYNHIYQLNPDGDYTYHQNSYLGILSYTLMLSNAAFIDFSLSGIRTEYSQYVYENPLDPRYVNPARKADVSGNAFYTGGTENWHFYHKTNSLTFKTDFTWQFDQVNQVKTGFDFRYHWLDYKNYQIVIDATTGFKPAMPKWGAFNYNVYHANPFQFAYYLQDKIEFDYLIVNAGLRFDYFEPDGKYLKDPNKINELDNLKPPFPDSLFQKASAKYQVSPRIGISYPISDQGAIHISYGYFFQIPPFENLYLNPNFRIPLTGDFPQNVGNTIGNTDLKPQQTIMYEIGLQQALTNEIGVKITGYYKDIRNLLATEIYIKNHFKKFSKLVNRDYGAVKGITISFEKRFVNGFGATIDYTYQVAKGNASDPNDAFIKAQANPPIEANKVLVPLNWDRRHSLNLTLTLGNPGDYIASIIGQLGSGLPYTPALQNQRTGFENSDNKPMFFNVDLYITKYFKLFGRELSVFLKVYNLFDRLNELDVFTDTGSAATTLELTRAQEPPRGDNTLAQFFTRPDFYSSPRQILLGASLSF